MADYINTSDNEVDMLEDEFTDNNLVTDFSSDSNIYTDPDCGCSVDSTDNYGKLPDEEAIRTQYYERNVVGFVEDTPDPNLYYPETLYENEKN